MPTLGTKTTKIDKAPTSQNNHAVEKKMDSKQHKEWWCSFYYIETKATEHEYHGREYRVAKG